MSQAATKSDLKNLEQRIAVKIDNLSQTVSNLGQTVSNVGQTVLNLGQTVSKLAQTVFKIEHRLENVENTMATKNDIQYVLNHIDAFAGQIQDYSRKAVIHDYRFNQLEPQIQDHEKRILLMEKKKSG